MDSRRPGELSRLLLIPDLLTLDTRMLKLVVILGFAISFAAGLVVGSRADWSRLTAATTRADSDPAPTPTTSPLAGERSDRPSRGRGPGGWLAAELGLTPDQHKQLDEIWTGVAERGRRRDHEGRRRAMRTERDEAVAALISADRWGAYEEIIAEFAERNAELDREFRSDFEQAVERTKQILTPAQRVKYDTLLERHRWGPPGERRRHGDGRDETGATSRPERRSESRPSHGTQKGAQE